MTTPPLDRSATCDIPAVHAAIASRSALRRERRALGQVLKVERDARCRLRQHEQRQARPYKRGREGDHDVRNSGQDDDRAVERSRERDLDEHDQGDHQRVVQVVPEHRAQRKHVFNLLTTNSKAYKVFKFLA